MYKTRGNIVLVLIIVAAMFALAPTRSAVADGTGTGGDFVPVPYTRLVDTTTGTGGSTTPFSTYETRTYKVLGVNGVPATGVSAVLLDVAASSSTSATDTRAIVWKSGTTMPSIGQLHYNVDTTPRSNTLAVAPGSNGNISVQGGNGATNVNIDVQGYFTQTGTGSSTSSGGFMPVTPRRVLDTTSGIGSSASPILDKGSVAFSVTSGGVPTGAKAVFANVTVTDAKGDGSLKMVANSSDLAAAKSKMEYHSGGIGDSGVSIPLSSDGKAVIQNLSMPSGYSVNVKVDIEGYFSGLTSNGGGFTPESDQKLLDTMTTTPLAAGESRDVAVGGTYDLPTYGVGGALLSIEAHDYTSNGSVEVYSAGWGDPGLANVSFVTAETGDSNSSTAVVRPGNLGTVTVVNNSAGPVNVKINLQGWFAAQPVVAPADQSSFLSATENLGTPVDVAQQAIYWSELAQAIPGSVDSTATPDDTSTVGSTAYSDDGVTQVSTSPTSVADAIGVVTSDAADDLGPMSTSSKISPSDAADHSCVANSGYRIFSGGRTLTYRGSAWPHAKLFTVALKSRWCANNSLMRIGTTYYPKPVVDTTFFGGFDWKVPSLSEIRVDHYFNGPSDHPRAGFRVKFSIPMQFCASGVSQVGCSQRNQYVGEEDTWDGYYQAWKSNSF